MKNLRHFDIRPLPIKHCWLPGCAEYEDAIAKVLLRGLLEVVDLVEILNSIHASWLWRRALDLQMQGIGLK